MRRAVKLRQLYQTRNFNTINYAHTAQTILAYLLGDYENSLSHASATEPHLGARIGNFFVSAHNFYYSLSLTALYSQSPASVQSEYLEKLQSNQQKMENWGNYCPENFLHRFLLVKSEICRLEHKFCTAIELYDRAITGATNNGFSQEAALGNELGAKFYLDWGKEKVAAGYMQEAYYGYASWGAKAKTDDLEHRYPDLLYPILQQVNPTLNLWETLATVTSNLSIHASTKVNNSSGSSMNNVLDFAAILKASQSLSRTIQLDELLHQLTRIIMQNSGGDHCTLILPDRNGEWQVKAIATTQGKRTLFPNKN